MRSIIIRFDLTGFVMNHSCFNAVFLAHRSSLLHTLQRMVRNPSTAEDLLHETYLRVSRALDERRVHHLEPFVFRTARNLALDHLRAGRLHERTLADDVPLAIVQRVPTRAGCLADAMHAERLLERLNACVAQLTVRQQRIFSLSRLHGSSHHDIATQLQVSISTVQKELKLVMALCTEVARRLDP
jgi:RNA polymerase sigma factor (sigma-70 family)